MSLEQDLDRVYGDRKEKRKDSEWYLESVTSSRDDDLRRITHGMKFRFVCHERTDDGESVERILPLVIYHSAGKKERHETGHPNQIAEDLRKMADYIDEMFEQGGQDGAGGAFSPPG